MVKAVREILELNKAKEFGGLFSIADISENGYRLMCFVNLQKERVCCIFKHA